MIARDREGGRSRCFEKKGGKHRGSSLLKGRRPWRVHTTSAPAYRRGQRRQTHHTSQLCPFLCFFSLRLSVPCFSCTAWRPHCVRSFHFFICILSLLSRKLPCLATRQLCSLPFLDLTPHWNQGRRRDQKRLFPCFFDGAHPGLSAFALSHGIADSCSCVCIVFLGDFPVLAQ